MYTYICVYVHMCNIYVHIYTHLCSCHQDHSTEQLQLPRRPLSPTRFAQQHHLPLTISRPCSPSEPIAATHTLSLQADVILGPLSPFTTRKAPSPVHSASLQSPVPTLLSHRLSLDWHSSLGALCPQPCPGPFSPHHQHLCLVRLPCRWGCLEICRRLLPVQPMTMALRGECQPVLID